METNKFSINEGEPEEPHTQSLLEEHTARAGTKLQDCYRLAEEQGWGKKNKREMFNSREEFHAYCIEEHSKVRCKVCMHMFLALLFVVGMFAAFYFPIKNGVVPVVP